MNENIICEIVSHNLKPFLSVKSILMRLLAALRVNNLWIVIGTVSSVNGVHP